MPCRVSGRWMASSGFRPLRARRALPFLLGVVPSFFGFLFISFCLCVVERKRRKGLALRRCCCCGFAGCSGVRTYASLSCLPPHVEKIQSQKDKLKRLNFKATKRRKGIRRCLGLSSCREGRRSDRETLKRKRGCWGVLNELR